MKSSSYLPAFDGAILSGWRSARGFGFARRIYGVLIAWQTRASDRAHLESLDERLLKDMGLSWADAAREAAKPFWRA